MSVYFWDVCVWWSGLHEPLTILYMCCQKSSDSSKHRFYNTTKPVKVCCGIWHQDVSKRSKSCKLINQAFMNHLTSQRCLLKLSVVEFGGVVEFHHVFQQFLNKVSLAEYCPMHHTRTFLLCGNSPYIAPPCHPSITFY